MHRSEMPSRRDRADDSVYTVTELTKRVKRLLESHWAALWVEGELSNVKRHGSGHVYFTLKDEGASLKGVLFRSNASRLRFVPEDGQKVRVYGSLTVYEPQGSYQITAVKMEPLGVGDLEIAFRQMYERLDKEGLFAAARKRALPTHPRTIGIVTSESGAAIRDLFSVLARRLPHVDLVVRSARVQGAGAAQDIARAIEEFDEWGGADVLIVGRGGGSLEDLWAFNEEIVARAIHASRTPIVSAVGHEVDTTIADFVADLRAPTPSAAAELIAPERDAVAEELRALGNDLAWAITQFLRDRRERVNLAARSAAFGSPLEFYRRRSQDVDGLRTRLEGAMTRSVDRRRLVLQAASGRLDALSPRAVLQRGYAIVRLPTGTVVRRTEEVSIGASVDVMLREGELTCRVESARAPDSAAVASRRESEE
jgi:exodeoxyribonuclease VII large subunit